MTKTTKQQRVKVGKYKYRSNIEWTRPDIQKVIRQVRCEKSWNKVYSYSAFIVCNLVKENLEKYQQHGFNPIDHYLQYQLVCALDDVLKFKFNLVLKILPNIGKMLEEKDAKEFSKKYREDIETELSLIQKMKDAHELPEEFFPKKC